MGHQTGREAAFQAARLRQPILELERKAAKARRRQQIWTAEELDLAKAKAHELWSGIQWE